MNDVLRVQVSQCQSYVVANADFSETRQRFFLKSPGTESSSDP